MPHPFEFPGMRRAVVPLVRTGNAIVCKLVAHRLPRFAAVAGALNDLSGPAARLRDIYPIRIHRRALQVVDFPPRKVGAAHIPAFALAVRCQDERAFPCAHQNSYLAHLDLLRGSLEMPASNIEVATELFPFTWNAPQAVTPRLYQRVRDCVATPIFVRARL